MFAGGLQLRNDAHTGATPPAAAEVPRLVAQAVSAPAQPPALPSTISPPVDTAPAETAPALAATSWTRDPQEGVDREAADPSALFADNWLHVYSTSAAHCVAAVCDDYWVPRFTSPELAQPGRLTATPCPPDQTGWHATTA